MRRATRRGPGKAIPHPRQGAGEAGRRLLERRASVGPWRRTLCRLAARPRTRASTARQASAGGARRRPRREVVNAPPSTNRALGDDALGAGRHDAGAPGRRGRGARRARADQAANATMSQRCAAARIGVTRSEKRLGEGGAAEVYRRTSRGRRVASRGGEAGGAPRSSPSGDRRMFTTRRLAQRLQTGHSAINDLASRRAPTSSWSGRRPSLARSARSRRAPASARFSPRHDIVETVVRRAGLRHTGSTSAAAMASAPRSEPAEHPGCRARVVEARDFGDRKAAGPAAEMTGIIKGSTAILARQAEGMRSTAQRPVRRRSGAPRAHSGDNPKRGDTSSASADLEIRCRPCRGARRRRRAQASSPAARLRRTAYASMAISTRRSNLARTHGVSPGAGDPRALVRRARAIRRGRARAHLHEPDSGPSRPGAASARMSLAHRAPAPSADSMATSPTPPRPEPSPPQSRDPAPAHAPARNVPAHPEPSRPETCTLPTPGSTAQGSSRHPSPTRGRARRKRRDTPFTHDSRALATLTFNPETGAA